jgi:hypothetical protein
MCVIGRYRLVCIVGRDNNRCLFPVDMKPMSTVCEEISRVLNTGANIIIVSIIVYNNVYVIFGSKRDEVTWGWRKLHNEELRDLYSSPSIIRMVKSRRIRCAGNVARLGKKRNARRLLMGKPEGKRPLGRPRRRCVDNIMMDLGEVGWVDVD